MADRAPPGPAQQQVLDQASAATDGQDASDALLGKRPRDDRSAPLVWRRPPDRPGTKEAPFPDLACREGNWKFLCLSDGSGSELYDLSNDPSESHNLAVDQPARVAEMRTRLLEWDASMPKDHPEAPVNQPSAAPKTEG